MRLQIKPFMDWIWLGTLLMALGAGLSLMDRRFRVASQRATAPSSVLESAA